MNKLKNIKKIAIGVIFLFMCCVLAIGITTLILYLGESIPPYINSKCILDVLYWITIIITMIYACYFIGN